MTSMLVNQEIRRAVELSVERGVVVASVSSGLLAVITGGSSYLLIRGERRVGSYQSL